MKSKIIIITILGVSLAACEKNWDGASEIRQASKPWADAVKLATNSPRDSLAPQIAHMQELRRQVESIKVSKCMEQPKSIYVEYMQYKIDFLTKFMAGDDQLGKKFKDPEDLRGYYKAISACMPEEQDLRKSAWDASILDQ